MKTTALLLLLFHFTLLAQDAFETPPTLSAAAILKPEFASGPGFRVRDAVPTYAGRNDYMIDSDYGVFEADGNTMLMHRVREIGAIAQLKEVSRTDTYKNALVSAAKSPLLAAKGLVQNPVSTVSGVPKGVWKFMNRVGQSVKEVGQDRERSAYEDSNAAQLIGFSKAKRAMAVQLGVDPYSSNEALQRELNGVSWASYAGQMTVKLGTAPIGGAAGIALTATSVTTNFQQALVDQSPSDLRLSNLKRLLAMGCERADINDFLNNIAFSPSVQTAIVMHLEALDGVGNRPAFIQLATSQSDAAKATPFSSHRRHASSCNFTPADIPSPASRRSAGCPWRSAPTAKSSSRWSGIMPCGLSARQDFVARIQAATIRGRSPQRGRHRALAVMLRPWLNRRPRGCRDHAGHAHRAEPSAVDALPSLACLGLAHARHFPRLRVGVRSGVLRRAGEGARGGSWPPPSWRCLSSCGRGAWRLLSSAPGSPSSWAGGSPSGPAMKQLAA